MFMNKTRGIFCRLLVLVMLFSVFGEVKTTNAMSEIGVKLESFSLNGDWQRFWNVSTNGVSYYRVELSKPGFLTIELKSFVQSTEISVMNNELTKEIVRKSSVNGKENEPAAYKYSNYFYPGIYIIKINHKNVGKFDLRALFEPVENDETGVNDDHKTAQEIEASEDVNGMLGLEDWYDYYKFTLDSDKIVKFTFASYQNGLTAILFNDYMVKKAEILEDYSYTATKSVPRVVETPVKLKAGTYYIRINRREDEKSTGLYKLSFETYNPVTQIKITKAGKAKIRKNKTIKLKQGKKVKLKAVVSPSSAEDKKLNWTSSSEYVASVDNKGKITANNEGEAIITATSTDGSEITAEITVKVISNNLNR